MQPTMAEIWDKLSLDDKEALLAYCRADHQDRNMTTLALTKIDTVIRILTTDVSITVEEQINSLNRLGHCGCTICKDHSVQARKIGRVLINYINRRSHEQKNS